MGAKAGKFFISYRRDDSKMTAGRVHDGLARIFGGNRIFMDVSNLKAGRRFDQELEKALDDCIVFIVVIGPRWLELYNERKRLQQRDHVHEEVAAALRRGVVTIPITIDGAEIPNPADLPEDIRDLAYWQKHDVRHEHYARDIDDLASAIRASTGVPDGEGRQTLKRRAMFGAGLAIAALGGLVVLNYSALNHVLERYSGASVAGKPNDDALAAATAEREQQRLREQAGADAIAKARVRDQNEATKRQQHDAIQAEIEAIRARAEAERKASERALEAERRARQDAEQRAREDADRRAREDTERRAREDAERLAREEAARTPPTCEELWRQRNVVFQSVSYCFSSEKAIAVFGNADCFRNQDQAWQAMGDANRQLVNRIRALESANGCSP